MASRVATEPAICSQRSLCLGHAVRRRGGHLRSPRGAGVTLAEYQIPWPNVPIVFCENPIPPDALANR
jgi:hypothetical protein